MTVNLGDGVQSDVEVVEGQESEVTQPDGASEEKPEGEHPDSEEEKPEEKPEDKPEPKESRIQKRIDKLTREKYQYKGEVEALRRQLEMLHGGSRQSVEPEQIPTRDQFENEVEYTRALKQHLKQEIAQEIKQERGQEVVQTNYSQQLAAARIAHEDFDDVLEDLQSIPVRSEVNQALATSKYAAEILYELGKDIQKASALSHMPVAAAIREIGKVEAVIEARKAQPKPAPKVSSAPDPVKPVGSRGNAGKRDHLKHPEDYTTEEWREAERKRLVNLKKR